jgi:phage tail sheath protein FI
MPEYLAPGVYIEEFEIGGKPIEGVSTSTAGFLGLTERGPTKPRLVTSFEEFNRIYGGYLEDFFLAYAVDGFFRNGGQRCYIARIVSKDNADTVKINLQDANGDFTMTLEAIGPGNWAKYIAIKIGPRSIEKVPPPPERKFFKLTIVYWREKPPTDPLVDPTKPDAESRNSPNRKEPDGIEVFDNLSADPTTLDYYKKKVNGISNFIKLVPQQGADGKPMATVPVDVEFQLLSDLGAADKDYDFGDAAEKKIIASDFDGKETEIVENGEKITERSGLKGFKQIDEIPIICSPDEPVIGVDLTGKLVDHCQDPDLKNRFVILQSSQDDTPSKISDFYPPKVSDYAGFYYPWIKVFDPRTNRDKLIPPGGHIAGIYARSDIERGVHKAPANEIVRGAKALQFDIGKRQQDILNPRGVNVIRAFTGRGIRVWGARTTATDPLWKYINVRRLFIFLESSVERGTQWVVFEPNNEQLWARVRQTITSFLTTVWRTGALMGTSQEEAFFVRADRSTMTQDDIDNGRLIVLIGVAPTKPAEFVIFRFTQFTAGAEEA